MVTILVVLGVMITLALSGMIYWKIKSEGGGLTFTEDVWHFKLVKWMWDAEKDLINNACPYYWSIVFSIIFLPIYLVIMGIYKGYKYIRKYTPPIKKLKPHVNKVKEVIPTLPESKKEAFGNVYSKGKDYIEKTVMTLVFIVLVIAVIVAGFKMVVFNLGVFMIIISVLLLIAITLYLVSYKPHLNKYHIAHYVEIWEGVKEIVIGLWGLIKIPYHMLSRILHVIGSKISKTYHNQCPPVEWK